jgi:hypothetical protein
MGEDGFILPPRPAAAVQSELSFSVETHRNKKLTLITVFVHSNL